MHAKFSKYHYGVAILYLVATPIIFFVASDVLSFRLHTDNLLPAFVIAACSTLGFLLYLVAIRKPKYTHNIVVIVVYGLLFAFPEEVIFRGLVQTYLHGIVSSSVLVIFLSAAIFGVAHVLNKASSLTPTGWNWNLVALTFIGGIPLAWIFALTQNLLIPTALHTIFLILFQLFPKTPAHHQPELYS